MVHLTVHLVRQVELCGPVCFTWMYPFERYMKVCKGYVRNRTRPEGCIVECYIAEEAVEFLAELFCDERTVGMPFAPITLDRRTSGATVVSVYGKLYDQAHLCVLQNTDEFRDYFNEHWELFKLEFPRYAKDEKWLTDKQNKTFADWVKARVATQLSEPGHKIPEIVRWLSDKPSNEVPKFAGYKIRGTQYTTKERDDMRSTQNSGVYLVAETPQVASARDKRMVREDMSFYGVIIEIWELNYEKFRFPIFKCDWVDNGKGAVVVDELGFTLVNLSKKGHFNVTFILGSCVEKIFYVTDPVDSQWSVVVRLPTKDYSDFVNEDVLGDTSISHPSITTTMPSIELSGNLADEKEMRYKRAGEEDIVVDGL